MPRRDAQVVILTRPRRAAVAEVSKLDLPGAVILLNPSRTPAGYEPVTTPVALASWPVRSFGAGD